MNNEQPIVNPATHYQIELRGRMDTQWLQSFDNLTEIINDETEQLEDITILHVYTDQSGMIGLLRRLHGLGMTIQQIQILPERRKETGQI